MKIQFNRPHVTNREIDYIKNAHTLGQFSGDGYYTKKCNEWFLNNINTEVLLTNSCTAALEMTAILADIKPGDEIIMPSYTFVSTANAFVLRGGVPVFVDIRKDTLNIDESLIESAVSAKTKAIVPVHYAGVSCEMDKIMSIAKENNLLVIEDSAQGLMSKYKGRFLGTIGNLGTYSFHETKNIISGEGGAICINDRNFLKRAEIIREKGTNRSQFFRGEVDKYTWVDIGSSFLPGEIIAAFLLAQLEDADKIIKRRIEIWNKYHSNLYDLEQEGFIRRPIVPETCEHNGHMYYILLANLGERTKLIKFLKEKGIYPVFHYVPLHSSYAGKKYCRIASSMTNTDSLSDRLLRLPLFYDITDQELEFICDSIHDFFKNN